MAASTKSPKKSAKKTTLQARLSSRDKRLIQKAAGLRRMPVSDYVRQVLVPQARREIDGADRNVIVLTAEEQLAFWQALHEPVKLTEAQRRLGRLMRGEE